MARTTRLTLLITAGIFVFLSGVILLAQYLRAERPIKEALSAPAPTDRLSDQLVLGEDRSISLTWKNKILTILNTRDLVEEYTRTSSHTTAKRIAWTKIIDQIKPLAEQVARPGQSGELILNSNGKRANTFIPATPQQTLDWNETLTNIGQAILNHKTTTSLAVTATIPPDNNSDALIAQYGLTTLLAKGESDFHDSTEARMANIRVGAEHFSGRLIAPGEIFSFNKNLGVVSEATGYQRELVIKNKVISAELGGGLCQVATTLYRAAMLAGLPITEQHNHSLSLHYYSPPGFDATIYPGSVDLKFVNNTPGYLLIKNYINGTKLFTEIYGTSDQRSVTIAPPVIKKWYSDGSFETSLIRTITLADSTNRIEEFKSVYQSPDNFTRVDNPYE